MADLHSKFEMFDRDSDGFLTHEELGIVMRLMGKNPTDNEVRDCAETCNDPTMISEREADTIIRDFQADDNKSQLKEMLSVFDTDNCGEIFENELRNVLSFLENQWKAQRWIVSLQR